MAWDPGSGNHLCNRNPYHPKIVFLVTEASRWRLKGSTEHLNDLMEGLLWLCTLKEKVSNLTGTHMAWSMAMA